MATFYMEDLRDILRKLDNEDISMSKALEMMNDKADGSRVYLLIIEADLKAASSMLSEKIDGKDVSLKPVLSNINRSIKAINAKL